MNSAKNEDNRLPDGWVLCQSKSIPGRKYYFNKKTGKSSWTQPQDDGKFDKKICKKEKMRRIEKKKKEEMSKRGAKRKTDSYEEQPLSSNKKRQKHDNKGSTPNTSRRCFSSQKEQKRNESPKQTSTPKSTPSKSFSSQNETPIKQSPVKNLANTRLSQLRALLNSEAKDKEDPDLSNKKGRVSPKSSESYRRNEHRSPAVNDSKLSQSPSSDSFQSMPSPSQFFAANKIISSMKAQLPEEYCCKEKQKDTFADIEQGIYSQTAEYAFSKHPATPPQFSEASKLMSAIKSKLAYKGSTSKEVEIFSSAKERMEVLKLSLSQETDREFNSSQFLSKSERNVEFDDPKNMSEAMEVEDFKEMRPNSPPTQTDSFVQADNLVLVVDTNIFIHELSLIQKVLNSHIKGYSEQATLLIPWRVISELDRLKDNNNGNGALCKRAKAAMDYLYKSLPQNSRIKGQSLRDSTSHIYPCEVPDDEILNCTLQQAGRGNNVILVSNDKNLSNKATVNGLKRINVEELKGMMESKPQPSNPDLFNSVICYEQSLQQLLANILENEMRAKYNEIWERVVFKPPPWSLQEVLQCLLKHWLAVFSEVFPRIEHLLVDLKNSLACVRDKDANTLTQSEVANFKDLCMDVAKKCQIIPDYMELAKKTVEKLSKGNDDEQTDGQDEGKEVVEAFEGTWTVLSSYCAKLATALGIEHSIEDNLPGNEPVSVLTAQWEQFNGHVNDLISAIDGVLCAEAGAAPVQRLQRALRDAPSLCRARLAAFCTHCRNMLQEAHSKFSQLAELLKLCKSRCSDLN